MIVSLPLIWSVQQIWFYTKSNDYKMAQKNIIRWFVLTCLVVLYSCNIPQNKKAEEKQTPAEEQSTEKPVLEKLVKFEHKEFKTCESLVTEILKTSPRYKEITKGLDKAVIKNGGSSFGIHLEGTPYPGEGNNQNYSKTYDFTIYEVYPDRQLNTARFSFNPATKKLYEYDIVNEKLIAIDFDRNLLKQYGTVCK
jgi:hypothetical protein